MKTWENKEMVNHPSHYGGADNVYEAIKVIDAWNLGFALGNTVKYISRAGKKDPNKELPRVIISAVPFLTCQCIS